MKLALTVFLLFLTALAASPAAAHSRPVRFDPEPGRVLEAAPSGITGWFSSDLRQDDAVTFIHVLDGKGARVDDNRPLLTRDRRSMSVGLQPGLGAGSYTVHWSTFDDADGEVFAGCYVFFVGQAAADAAVANGSALDGGAGCPATTPEHSATLSIEVDTSGSSATVRMVPENFVVQPGDGKSVIAGTGHFHIYLDQVPLDAITGHTHDGEDSHTTSSSGHDHGDDHAADEGPVHWYEETYTFKDLSPGQHTVAVALFHGDHLTPLSPPVVAEATFTIGGTDGGAPVWALILGVVLALGAGLGIGRKMRAS